MYADITLINGRVLTMDAAQPRVHALAICGDRIASVGTLAEVEALTGPDTRVIDCQGGTVLPGFVESHLHLVLGGAELGHLQLGGVAGDATAKRLRDFADRNPGLPLLMAQGVDYGLFGHPTSRADLDVIVPDRPVALMSPDHHTVWANTAALRAAGLLHGATMPHGHEVVLDDDGIATGELREFEAFAPVIALGGDARLSLGIATGEEPDPWPSEAEQATDRAVVAVGLAHCARHGVTSIVNMDGNRYTLTLLAGLRDAGQLTARVKVPFHFKPHMDMSDLDRATAMTRDFADDWLCSGFVKFFMDGVVDSRTAFMLNDYPGQPGHRSEPLFAPDRFAAIATEVDRRGLQIAVHAIGDGAVRTTIDGLAAARAANGARDSRHRIEHIELIDRTDVPRLAANAITASVQPVHAPGAMDFSAEAMHKVIDRNRFADAYLCRDLVDAGAPVAFASDWPVTDISILRGIKAALTRPIYAGGTDQRLMLHDTLRAYTAGGAWAAHLDHLTGTLRPGLAADVVVLSGDIEATAPDAIDCLSVAMTIAGGRITWADGI
jgi:predicted amidohydrolase YtcJ